MDEFEQNDLEKETNDSYNTFYQNAIMMIKKMLSSKIISEVYFSVFVMKLGRRVL